TLPLPATELSWREYLPRVHENIEEALAHGYDRAQTRQAALASTSQLPLQNGHIGEPHASFIRASVKSNLYLPYIGQTRIEASYGPLRILDYYAATCTNPGTVDVLVEVFQGRFKMAANYDAAYFSSELMQALTDEFIQQIDDLAQASLALEEQSNTKAEGVVSAVAEQLLDIAEQVLRRKLDVASLQLDLESDLGMDSLERIRLVGRLRQALPTVDTRALLGCRRLSEMAELIRPASEPAKSLPAIPYLHIAARCHQHPDAIAVQDGEISLSYGQLNLQANQLAHYLRSLGIGPGQLVGLMLPRSAEFAIAVLAVLKAGAAYVPIDPGYPGARIGYMVSHSRISVLITLQTLLPILAELNQPLHQILLMDRLQSQYRGEQQYLGCDVWLSQPAYDPECVNNPDDLMVVLYTSGSTGTPKGVALAHRGYMNRMDWHQDLFCLDVGERVAQKTSICFDISVWELLWPLLNGGIICPVAQDLLRDPWQLADWIESEHIAVMHFVPSLFNEFLLALAGSQHRFESLRWLIFSGEALPVSLVQNWFDQRGKHVALANLYGPTEASIDVTAHLMHSRPVQGTLRIPIGPAMPDVHIVILDEAMQLLPDGQVGELWIGGIQLAQGYLYDADRTAENFRANPFPEIPGAYLYRTGDLAVRLADGSFDYRGRIDNQIKIRGFRVELGEIEAAIDAISGITENAVLAQDMGEGNLRLVAWLSGNELPLAELRTILAQRLPEYMLPQQVFHADALPKNHNGKLDRNALKQWTAAGHAPEISQAPTSSAAMLGPAQAWMTHYFEPPYDWKGYTRHRYLQPLDIEVFQQALNLIAERHPVLRTLFIETQGRLQPIAAPDHAPLTVDVYDVAHLDGNGREQEIRRLVTETLAQLHPEQFPLLRVLVMKTSAADCCEIAVVGHHLISDLVSNNILFREVWQLYGLLATKQAPQLGAAPPSFRAYTDELHSVKTQAARQSYIDYWCGQFQDPQRRLQIPCEHQLGCNEESSSAVERLVLPRQVFQNISDVRKHFQSSLYPLLLAPAYRLLGEWCQQQWVTLSHRSHGRDFGDGRTFFDSVGNFAVNYPVTVELSAAESWRTLVTKITQAFAEVPLNGVSYDLVGGDLPEALYPDEKLTPVRINYLGNRSLPKSDIFAFDEEEWDRRYAAPQQRRTALIEIFLSTVNGQLRIDIDYSRHFFTAASMQRLGQRYLELLTELIESVHNQPTLRLVSVRQPTAGDTPMESAYQGPSAAPAGRHRVALVTGASRGIGRAIALKLSREGAIVALTARSRAGLEVVAKEITDAGGIALVVPADITDAGQVQAVVDDILSRFGQLDVLVNNAGITGLSALASSDSETWKRVIEVNLFGTYHLCRAVTPQMMKQRSGKIINLGSDSSFIGYPLFSAYAASKHGLIGMTRSLAEELKPHNIQVNAVCPAFVDTDMTPTAFRAHAIPTDAVADAVAFLASAQAQWITGESVKLYGRQDMYWFGADKMGGLEAMMGVAKVARAQEERHG
ncbi:MAG: amino acid adenylation domain-containing protein, partial [Methylococcales bacterium]